MAGIGFELQRVLRRGGIGSFFKVVLAGSIVVAGPWLLTILGIFFIGKYAETSIGALRNVFTGSIVYSYAFSLILFGGTHYIFTRFVADLIYEEKRREAGSALLSFSLLIGILAALISGVASLRITTFSGSEQFTYRIALILLFVSINLTWLLMIFISLLKKYMAIFSLYLIGMVISFLGVKLLGIPLKTSGALLGYSIGQTFIVIALYLLVSMEYKPNGLGFKGLFSYIGRYKFLLLTGIFYYWGMWADKIVFKIFMGNPVPGTFFQIFDYYDIPVYIANLTIIPGMIYYIIVTEIDFYISLKDFLKGLHENTYTKIQKKKYAMINSVKTGIREQGFFQGTFTAAIALLAGGISEYLFSGTMAVGVFRIVLVGVFFHLTLLILIIYLFYLEFYLYAFISALLFFIINLSLSLVIALTASVSFLGYSYMIASCISAIVAAVLLMVSIKSIDRELYARQSGS